MSPREANPKRQVYILDLDGTLMPSAGIDNQCFWQAVFACFEFQQAAPDLHSFKHVTDAGILHEWCRTQLGRTASKEETRWIKQNFLQQLETAYQQQPACFAPLPGVQHWLNTQSGRQHVHTGIATGGWKHSARLKLRLSRLDRFALPLASSDDAIERTEIMQIAARRTLGEHPQEERVAYTYIGDGEWDYAASRELGWAFIGIASGQRAQQLARAGATDIRSDFTTLSG